MMNMSIAGIASTAKDLPLAHWQLFCGGENAGKGGAGMAIGKSDQPFSGGGSVPAASHAELNVYHLPDGSWLFESPAHLPPAQVLLSPDGGKIRYHLPECSDSQGQKTKLNHFLRTAYECRFCREGVVSLHAACVENGECAVAFTGSSGMGKSTRALAWTSALGFQWISGDRPAVRLEAAGSTACGVPWDGKEQIFRPVARPLRAIMEVRRSSVNHIRRLSPQQARSLLMRQTFVPMWDTQASVMAMANIRALIERTPVYRVFCGPDERDAKEIYDILFNHPERIGGEEKEMRIKDGFVLRNVVDEYIVMPTGENIARFSGAVILNEVSAFVFEQMKKPISGEDLLAAVLSQFDTDEQTARADLEELLATFRELKMIEA